MPSLTSRPESQSASLTAKLPHEAAGPTQVLQCTPRRRLQHNHRHTCRDQSSGLTCAICDVDRDERPCLQQKQHHQKSTVRLLHADKRGRMTAGELGATETSPWDDSSPERGSRAAGRRSTTAELSSRKKAYFLQQ